MLLRKVPLRDEAGSVIKWYGSADIEDRKRAEDGVRRSEDRLRQYRYAENLKGAAIRNRDLLCSVLYLPEQTLWIDQSPRTIRHDRLNFNPSPIP